MLCCALPEVVVRVISCVDSIFDKARLQYVYQVSTTKCPICLVENWRIRRLGILKEKFAESCHRAISLVFRPYDYEYSCVVYVGLASFELQRHKLVKFGERNICSCHLDVFERQGRLLCGRKGFFADADEVCPCYFERHVNV